MNIDKQDELGVILTGVFGLLALVWILVKAPPKNFADFALKTFGSFTVGAGISIVIPFYIAARVLYNLYRYALYLIFVAAALLYLNYLKQEAIINLIIFGFALASVIDIVIHVRRQIKEMTNMEEPSINDQAALDSSFIYMPPDQKRLVENMDKSKSFDIALSFAGEERDFVRSVAKGLKSKKISVFFDEFEEATLWGSDLVEHLADIYGKRSKFVIIFCSSAYIKKGWPKHEKSAALYRLIEGEKGRILPIMLENVEVPGLPKSIGYLSGSEYTPERIVELAFKKIRENRAVD